MKKIDKNPTGRSGIEDVNAYISEFPAETQKKLEEIRQVIREEAPDAAEGMNYGIPTFTLHGNLVHYAGYKGHIGFYPGAAGIEVFKDEMSGYKTSKGTVQFPLDKIPATLVRKIVRFLVEQNMEKAKERAKPKVGFLPTLSAPARRALETEGIKTLKQLSGYSESAILKLHGMGPVSIPALKAALETEGLSFKK